MSYTRELYVIRQERPLLAQLNLGAKFMTYLPSCWQTERLIVQDGTLAEVDELRQLMQGLWSQLCSFS